MFFLGLIHNPPPNSHFYPRILKHSDYVGPRAGGKDRHMDANPQHAATTFTESVARFLATATWLDDGHLPSIMALQALAAELDKEVTAALVAQFGLLHRSLLKAKPVDDAPVNPFEELLRR